MSEELKGTIKTLSEHPEVKCGSYAFVEDANITYADIYLLLNYIRKLEQENKDLKEKNEFLMKRDNKCQVLEQVLKDITDYLECYLLGNFKYKESQKEFEKLLDMSKRGGIDEINNSR